MSKNDGGAAFPISNPQLHDRFNGMSLRDYFAARAMQGMLVDASNWGADTLGIIAKYAYAMADAMLKEREEGK